MDTLENKLKDKEENATSRNPLTNAWVGSGPMMLYNQKCFYCNQQVKSTIIYNIYIYIYNIYIYIYSIPGIITEPRGAIFTKYSFPSLRPGNSYPICSKIDYEEIKIWGRVFTCSNFPERPCGIPSLISPFNKKQHSKQAQT